MIREITSYLDQHQVQLIAVSKTKSAEDILKIYQKGVRDFGENRVQEMCSKYEQLPKDIRWHLIGHLQTNKVKYIIPFTYMIHSVDSLKLLREIDKQASKYNRTMDYLLQLHIAREETKFGFDFDECTALLQSDEWKKLQHVRLRGLMAMATNTTDEQLIKQEFKQLQSYFNYLKKQFINDDKLRSFTELCIGMSNDYKIAIACGATMVRIGSLIFGERNYTM